MIHKIQIEQERIGDYEKFLAKVENRQYLQLKVEDCRKYDGQARTFINASMQVQKEIVPLSLRVYKDGKADVAIFAFLAETAREVLGRLENLAGFRFGQIKHHTEQVILELA